MKLPLKQPKKGAKTLSVTEFATGEGIAGADIYFDNGNNSSESGVDFTYTLNTTLMEVQKLIATHPDYILWEEDETLVEGENLTVNIRMVRRV